jgi:hypothetical protein
MKFFVYLILIIYTYTLSKIEQSIHLTPTKLLITDNKEDIILPSPNLFEKDISGLNFTTKLKDAETALYRKLSTQNFLKTNFNATAYRYDNVPTYRIDKMTTVIDIRPNKTFADINEKITFTLENGVFSSISRKISLNGSSDSLVAFRLTSR